MIKRPCYEEHDEYILDYDTSNASFIALASVLRRKGIKNWAFFLKLYDEDLVGVDPYDENLSPEYQLKVIMECRRNIWYFIREVMRIPAPGDPMQFKLHRGNLALLWACANNIPVYEVLPRQHGKTWAVISYALWTFNYASDYTNMLFMNKQLGDSQLNLKRLKDARELLPPYLRVDKTQTDKGELKENRGNVNSMRNALHNEITVKASARNPIAADELGRGMTVAWVWIDEIAFVQFNRIIYAAMAPAWSKAAEIAIEKGRPTGKILTTTPSDLSTDMGKFAYEVRDDAAKFDESLYDKDPSELSTWMDKNSKNGYLYIEFSYMQLDHKNPDKWFEKQCKDLLYDWTKIRREVLLQWNNASSNSPFDENDLRDIRSACKKANELDSIIINKYYKLNVYKKIDPSRKYIITIDPAKGRGTQSDRTAITVIDAKTQECCAVFKSSVIQYKETFRFVYTLVNNYIPDAVLVVENNIDTLIEYIMNSSLRSLLYYEFDRTPAKEKRKKGVKVHDQKNNILYGITTTSANRPKYFDILFEMVRTQQHLLFAEELVEEIETLEYKSATRIEAVSGAHDDVIISYLLGIYVLRYGNNRPRFGLFFADDLGTEYNTTDTSIFKQPSRNTNMNNRDANSLLDNPFWNELLDEMLQTSTPEDMERRWKKSQVTSKGELLDYKTNVFTGEKDLAGVSKIRGDAFYELNARDDSESVFGPDDSFRILGSSNIDDFEDANDWF